METPRQDNDVRGMDIEDEAVQVQVGHIIEAIGQIIPLFDSSHSDLVDNYKMNHAATDSNKKHLQRKQQQQDQLDSLKKDDKVRRIDTSISEVIDRDLETLKGHSQEVGELLKQFMQFAEGDGVYRQGGGDNKKLAPAERTMDILTAVCSNTMIDRPFFKLALFSEIIRARGMPLERLSQLMTTPKGGNKVWKMLPSLINTSMDILIKLCCSWMLYASLIDLKKMTAKTAAAANNDEEKNDDCLLDSSDPCVLNTITCINNILLKRRNSSLITLLPGETTLQKKIENRSVMIENLSDVLIPCLFKIESVLSNIM